MGSYLIGTAYCLLALVIVVVELAPRFNTEHIWAKLTLGAVGLWSLVQADRYLG